MLVPSPFPETPLADLSSDGFTEVNRKSLPLSVSWLLVSLFIFQLCFVMPVKMVAEISPVSNQPAKAGWGGVVSEQTLYPHLPLPLKSSWDPPTDRSCSLLLFLVRSYSRKIAHFTRLFVWLFEMVWRPPVAPLLLAILLAIQKGSAFLAAAEEETCTGMVPLKRRGEVVSITDFGGVGAGRTLNTAAFETAVSRIEQRNAPGGSLLYIPSGVWLTGTFGLVSHMTLFLAASAVIKATQVTVLFPFVSEFFYS
ncbi:hypothetical protein B296_00006272 [Ensete ventricosum]|uniref:Pectate lyase superfamily protein domain-containing protein n=1 Tax=Ensete ventricosum TaxID=4639 RepID=A0A427AZG6_ENSVE|nr:hypothetical protein B296_00006272 [Ensete ventricosum]